MNQKTFGRKRKYYNSNYYFTVFILLILIILLVVNNKAKIENEILIKNHSIYKEVSKSIEEGDTKSIINPLVSLSSKYDDDYNITYSLAYVYLYNGDFDTASIMYTKTLDLNPYLVENKDFMYQYAIALSNNQQLDSAIIVIDRLLTLPIDEAFKGRVTELRDSISNMKGTTT